MAKLEALFVFLVGAINFLPVLGVLSANRLSQAYGVEVTGSDLEILLRHRALLFGIVGGFVFYSLFAAQYQNAALMLAGISMLGFLVLCWWVGDYNRELFKILTADVVGLLCLVGAVVCRWLCAAAGQ